MSLLDAKAGGVSDLDGLKRRFWRDSPESRREALLPFIWGTVRESGKCSATALAVLPRV